MTLLRPLAPIALMLAACSACGDDGDSTADAAPPDPCAPLMTFTGEYVDWDGGSGIAFANITLRSDPTFTDATAPNGRFFAGTCIPRADALADVLPMSGTTYPPGIIVINRMVQAALPTLSYRAFTATRAADFGYSASLAHVFVQVIGGSRTVTTAATPAVMQVNSGASWAAGNTGTTIYLGNIPVSAQTTLTVTGGDVTGPTMIPLSAGAFTYVTLLATD